MNTQPPPQLATHEACEFSESEIEAYLEKKKSFLEFLDQKSEARISQAIERKLAWVA